MAKETVEYYPAHVAQMIKRWETALDAENLPALLVHSGTPLISFLDDYEYPFRPNPHFLAWLPLTHHHDSALLFIPGEKPRLFYYQPDDYWHTPPSDPEAWWAQHFDIRVVSGAEDWHQELLAQLQNLPFAVGEMAALGDAPCLAEVFSADRINPAALVNRLHVARTRKTPYEIACMREASRTAASAHLAAERAFREGASEFRIHQNYLNVSQHSDAQLPYHNIVALNEHGAVLHYQGRNKTAPEHSRSFLIDAGCTFNAYASDITRTYARDAGEFADLVAAMDEMQLALISQVRAGIDYRDLHLQTHLGTAGILEDSGIINIPAQDAVATGLSSVFFPHGLGHYIGLQTHDVSGLTDDAGEPIPRPEGHPFLRLTRVLENANVLTIEPGLYFIEPLLRQWKQTGDSAAINWARVEALAPYGGIRIEDNVVVTEEGSDNLTREAFSELV